MQLIEGVRGETDGEEKARTVAASIAQDSRGARAAPMTA